ncbi:DUF814 domain-containing protein [Verticillium alfalfae VaMs.102]|uniref:Ribosome quality control complex subunit 2 n=1 Tax=Verticillium alfalfae (strain VaMs.102 / ATCC MYA-4576 / FGSC 10136) TaxID=526221 RepID=C9SBG4_VERA1|nr:DUF814 domain-containing protein [Verticillium alfalfae VaMs.102]EEY15698.1 DUF814 domain-containing protein [Verticillium alfalfae VaMs.102]
MPPAPPSSCATFAVRIDSLTLVQCDEKRPCTACVRHGTECSLVQGPPSAATSPDEQQHASPPGDMGLSTVRSSSNGSFDRPVPGPAAMLRRDLSASGSQQTRPISSSTPLSTPDRDPYAVVPIGTWYTDLELMHHYSTSAYLTLPRSADLQHVWQLEIPKIALTHRRAAYALTASQHQTDAGGRHACGSPTHHGCQMRPPIRCVVRSSSLSAYAMFPHQQQCSSPDQPLPSPTVDNILDVFLLIRGMSEILDASELLIRRGTLGHLFAQETAPPTSTPLLDSVAARLTTFNAAIDPTNIIVARELEGLISWIHRATATTAMPENRIALTWPIDLSGDYISLLRQRDPAALSLLAYYCVIVSAVEPTTWYMQGWGRNALCSIEECLSPAWKELIEWPLLFATGRETSLPSTSPEPRISIMKQRFSSLDVKVIAHELHESLVTLRLANVYDLSSKILLLKFAKPDNKKQILIDSGFRCHLTDFARTTAAAPSAFVARLRKFLKTRRLTAVSQVGTDRIIEFTFSDGQYRLFLEFFASGNVILTDAELRILTLLRNVPEGEGQEPQRVGLSYSLDNRQNFGGVPPLTRERLQNALRVMAAKAANAPTTGKKKIKPGDQLRKGLATTITELPPMLVDHAFQVTGFDPTKTPAELLDSDALLDSLLHALTVARKVVEDATSSATTTGYVIAKYRQKSEETEEKPDDGAETKREDLLYDDFHPFLPQKFADDPSVKVLTFDGFNKTVDEFFFLARGPETREAQSLNEQKAAAIEANVERVQEAMDAVNGLVQQGMDWVNIGKLIEREQKRHNPNLMTLLLGTEAVEDEDEAYETGSDASDSEDDEDGAKAKGADRRLQIEINLGLSPWANAREYYDQRRTAAVKELKTVQHSTMALKNAEKKITEDLKKGLKQEKAVLQPIRKQMWFEKFIWFLSSDGYLVLGGKDAQQNETLYKRYLRKGDVYCHADMHGAATVIVKNKQDTPDAPIPPSTLAQAGMLSVCSSSAWDSKAGMGAWWVRADQVSKSAPTGEYLPAAAFMGAGPGRNFLPPGRPLGAGAFGIHVSGSVEGEARPKHVEGTGLRGRMKSPGRVAVRGVTKLASPTARLDRWFNGR